VEFHLDHARGYREVVTLGEFVKERSLYPLARDRVVVALHALAHFLAQLRKVFEPNRFSQRIVDRRRQTLPDLFHLRLEDRILASKIRDSVIGREGHFDRAILARLGAGELILEARDKLTPAELDRDVLALAAGKLYLTDLPDKIDDDQVAFFGRAVDQLCFSL